MNYTSEFLKTLDARGYIAQCTDGKALDAVANEGIITGYIGYDCTAPSLHVGNLISILMLRHLQQAGHRPIVVIGGGTTKVGDPSGKDESRQLLTQEKIDENNKVDTDKEIETYTNKFIKRMESNLANFSYNVVIASLHEMHTFLSKAINKQYTKKMLLENYKKILITLIPIIPHFSSECLVLIGGKGEINWPKINENMIKDEQINIVIQINGKKRGLITAKKDVDEKELFTLISMNKTLYKYIKNEKIKKNIFIKNKLINIII